MVLLGQMLWDGDGVAMDKVRPGQLWKEAALLGDPHAQYHLAKEYCKEGSLEQVIWLRRSTMQAHDRASHRLLQVVGDELQKYDRGGSGRFVFEIGLAFTFIEPWEDVTGSSLAAT